MRRRSDGKDDAKYEVRKSEGGAAPMAAIAMAKSVKLILFCKSE